MKIIYKNMGFGGGAPKSLLEYIKIAQKNKYRTAAIGQFTYLPKDYYNSDIKVIEIPYFVLTKPFSSFILLVRYLKIIKEEKPNLIHCITSVNSMFHTIIEDIIKVPILYNIPGGKINKVTANMLRGKKIIVFSKENVYELVKYNHSINEIYEFSNRIDFKEMQDFKEKHRKTEQKQIKGEDISFLITSRISSDKIHSIMHMVELVDKLNSNNYNVILHILGDGDLYDTVNKQAESVNSKYDRRIIKLHGYKSNVHEYILNSDLVFGKGRSVIDGIIFKKPAFVVDENRNIIECNIDNFENLSDNNFTGRNNKSNTITYQEIEKKIAKLNHTDTFNKVEKLYHLTKHKYDISIIEKDILKLYQDNISSDTTYSYNIFKLIFKYFVFYLKTFCYYLFK